MRWLLWSFCKVLVGNRIFRCFAGPVHIHHPPPGTIVQQLNAVDAALKRLAVRSFPRFIRAEDVRDATESFDLTRNFALIKRVFLEVFPGAVNVSLHSHGLVSQRAILLLEGSDELRFWNKQRAKAIPVPISRRTAD